ncbi:MAG TPA: TerC family protein [Chitinophagaceae bacterium]|nr:TerC family protein [Chitinophagaceae bacterium]
MDYEIVIALLTLVALEVVLGIDNIIFISILAAKLPVAQQKRARRIGLLLAGVLRLGLLSVITLIMKLERDLFTVFKMGISGKDLVLIAGGLFLLYKSAVEIYHKTEGVEGDQSVKLRASSFASVIGQVLVMDLVFSIDSIITAVGLVEQVWIMYVAIVITVAIMFFASEPVSGFVNRHPAFKILALSFLLLIGFALLVEGFGIEIPKGYIYFAMAFSLFVDVIQMRMQRKKSVPVDLHEHYTEAEKRADKKMM